MEKEKTKLYQKWWFWLCIVLIVFIVGGLIVFNKNDNNKSKTTTTYTSTGNQKVQSQNNTDELRKNIKIEKLGIAKNGDFIIKITNNNKIPVCIDAISTAYKDKSGNFIKKENSSDSFFGIDANSETVTYNSGYNEDFTQYPNYEFNYSFANIADNFVYNNFEITANDTGKQIAIQIKNNNAETVESIKVNVVYYQNEKVVGIEEGYYYDSPTSQGQSAYINAEYPKDNDYNQISFNDYKVFFVQASIE